MGSKEKEAMMTSKEENKLKENATLIVKPKSEKQEVTLVAPDGGWGWIVVFASALSNFITIPIMQSFGLLFQDAFIELEMSTTDLSIIINVNSAFGMSLGLLNGPLLRKYGYRKIAILGGILSFVGITSTSWANSFAHFIISYSLISSAGGFLLMSSFSLALNTYFREKRGHAAGLSSALSGLGPVLMPQIITFLLKNYNIQGTTLILGGFALHSLVAALLLQPIKWHMKKVREESEESEVKPPVFIEEEKRISLVTPEEPRKRVRANTINSDYEYDHDVDCHSMYGFETPLVSHRTFGSSVQLAAKRKTSTVSFNRSVSQVDDGVQPGTLKVKHAPSNYSWWESVETVNLGSSVKIFDEKPYFPLKQNFYNDEELKDKKKPENEPLPSLPIKIVVEDTEKLNNNNKTSCDETDCSKTPDTKEKSNICLRIGQRIVKFFDLDLLRDPGYVILMVGMSLAVCAEINFSMFTPLILADYGFSKEQIATVMSVIATADIVFRFLAPYVGDLLKLKAQAMYLIALVMLIISRLALMLFHDYQGALIVAIALGVAKGFRTVYMSVVIPSYVPLERLPSASGLQMVVNSLFTVASIPVIAHVRDSTGSYNMCIGALNCITLITVFMWTIQIIYKTCKSRKSTTVV
ncbi:uncharacterized protein [Anabrus simplex]|uniref:uncharacterized protein n=1 Tax=Anabrus simplex TaxID=316456 RepID=UPI0035A2F058